MKKTGEQVEEDISSNYIDENEETLPNVNLILPVAYQETVMVKVKAKAGLVFKKTSIENHAIISSEHIGIKTSNTIKHIILPFNYKEDTSGIKELSILKEPDKLEYIQNKEQLDLTGGVLQVTYEDGLVEEVEMTDEDVISSGFNNNIIGEQTITVTYKSKSVQFNVLIIEGGKEEENKYRISGTLWNDENRDGEKQDDEKKIDNVLVMLIDTNSIKEKTYTDTNGYYSFSNISKGNYMIICVYDTDKYTLTEYKKIGVSDNVSSKAVNQEITLDGDKTTVGMIEINNMSKNFPNMNIGLIGKSNTSNLEIKKYVEKIIVTNAKGTKEYTYDNTELAKIEIKAKEIEGTEIEIQYKIVITNKGETTTTLEKLYDYLPNDLGIESSKSSNWIEDKEAFVNMSLENSKLQPGESAETRIVVTKTLTSNSTGTIVNEVSLSNNKASAEVIISVSTGEVFIWIGIILLVIALLTILIIILGKKKILKFGKLFIFIALIPMVIFVDNISNAQYSPSNASFLRYTADSSGNARFKTSDGSMYATCVDHDCAAHGTKYVEEGGISYWDCSWALNNSSLGSGRHYAPYAYNTETPTYVKSSTSYTKHTLTGNTDEYLDMKTEGEYCIIGPLEIECSNNNGYTFSVTTSKGVKIDDVELYNENEKGKYTDYSVYLKIPKSSCNNGIVITASNKQDVVKTVTTSYNITTQYNPGDGCQRISTDPWSHDDTVEEGGTKKLTWSYINGILDITKKDFDANTIMEGIKVNITGPNEYNETKTTDSNGEIHLDNLTPGEYTIKETSAPYGYTKLVTTSETIDGGEYANVIIENEKQTGNLILEKTDYNNPDKKISGIEFKIKNEDTGKYVTDGTKGSRCTKSVHIKDENYYVDKESDATTFITNGNGRICISNLLVGTYTITEVGVGDSKIYKLDNGYISWQYETKGGGSSSDYGDGRTATVLVDRQTSDQTKEQNDSQDYATNLDVYNKQYYVSVSGYVWEDIGDGKDSFKDNKYVENTNDKLMENIPVYLKKITASRWGTTTEEVQQTRTNANGEYKFDKLEVANLGNYYIEFEYDGLVYTNCVSDFKTVNTTPTTATRTKTTTTYTSKEVSKTVTETVEKTYTEKEQGAIKDGVYKICSSINTGYLLDVKTWSLKDYNPSAGTISDNGVIHLYHDADTTNQRFLIQYQGNGYYCIFPVNSGKALEVYGATTSTGISTGALVTQMTANGSDAQLWKIEKRSNGKYRFVPKCSTGKCIDVANGTVGDGNGIQIYDKNDTVAQDFVLTEYPNSDAILSEGLYNICLSNSSYCWDVDGASSANFTNLHLQQIDSSKKNQQFRIIHKGYGWYEIVAEHSNKAVELPNANTASGTQIGQYQRNNTDAQRWRIIPIGNGKYKFMTKCASGMTIDILNNNQSSGGVVQLYADNETEAQGFRLVKVTEYETKTKTVTEYVDTPSTKTTKENYQDYSKVNTAIQKAQDDNQKTSKAAENAKTRDDFNTSFAGVENNGTNQGKTKGGQTLKYTKDSSNYSSTLKEYYISGTNAYYNYDGSNVKGPNSITYGIAANTKESKNASSQTYNLENYFAPGYTEEIKYVNLGLYKRGQPDLCLVNDIQNATVSINNKTHVYNYENRYKNQSDENSEYKQSMDIGVKFANERGTTSYTRAIYKSDVDYINNSNTDIELKVGVTYHIRVINDGSNVATKANTIVDYYDSNYTVKSVGSGIDENGEIIDGLTYSDGEYNSDYKKLNISTNKIIKSGEYADIYIKFEMNRKTVLNIIDGNEPLNNVAEITSYTCYDESGKAIYAGVDTDSAPGNAKPGDKATYEDDTDSAPTFILQYSKEERKVSGNVFEDLAEAETSGGMGIEYLGNGIFDANRETGIQNVTVKLIDKSGAGIEEQTVTTDKDGNYTFTKYIPGEYIVTYTWGNEAHTKRKRIIEDQKGNVIENADELTDEQIKEKEYVKKQDEEEVYFDVYHYKGTTQPEEEWNRKKDNPSTWYKENIETRYTDALDEWKKGEETEYREGREDIDNISKVMTYKNQTNLDKTKQLTAKSALMKCGVEKTNKTTTDDDTLIPEYKIENVDYGIILRAQQDIDMTKRIAGIKLVLANGQTIIDVTIDENGKVSGVQNGLQYFKPDVSNTSHPNGQAYIQVDAELIQGSILQVGYVFKARNISDLDYVTKNYYYYAIKGKESDKVSMSPDAVIDYLDKDWGYDEKLNEQWTEKTFNELKQMAKDGLFAEEVYKTSSEGNDIENKRILYAEALKDEILKVGESSKTEFALTVSKTLSSANEIDLDNDTEVIEIENTQAGRPLKSTLGNFITGSTKLKPEADTGISETVTISTPTGLTAGSIIIYSIIGIIALVILGFGIVIIKKKVIK